MYRNSSTIDSISMEGILEVSGSPDLRSQEETTGLVDRKIQYDDADWFNENPNRAAGLMQQLRNTVHI